ASLEAGQAVIDQRRVIRKSIRAAAEFEAIDPLDGAKQRLGLDLAPIVQAAETALPGDVEHDQTKAQADGLEVFPAAVEQSGEAGAVQVGPAQVSSAVRARKTSARASRA